MNVHQDGLILDRVFPFQIDAVTLAAGDNADDAFHWHSFLEVTCILEGSGCYYVSDRAYEVSPGDIVIFNSAELHGWQVFQNEMRVLAMVFSDSLVAGYGDLMDMEYLRPFVGRGSNFRNRIGKGRALRAADRGHHAGDPGRMAAAGRRLSADDQGRRAAGPDDAGAPLP